MAMNVQEKLEILADAAKYDASCASSGARRAGNGQGIGHSERHGHLPLLHAGRTLRVAA